MTPAKTLLIAVLATAFCQCAGGPALERKILIQPGTRALVSLQQATITLTVINQSALTKDQAQAARTQDRSLKIIPDAQVQLLLDLLGGQEFFANASATADPEARSWLTVMSGAEKWVLSGRAARGDHASMQRFSKCLNQFTDVYSSNDNFAGSKLTPRDFKRASESINSATKRKKGNSRQP